VLVNRGMPAFGVSPHAAPSAAAAGANDSIKRQGLILFSNGSRAGDSSGCRRSGDGLRSLRARSALDGVSWVQGG
jgi:hypothetical protein